MEKGQATALRHLLTKRFGPLPDDITARIDQASLAQLETWLDRLMDAPTLEAIFDTP